MYDPVKCKYKIKILGKTLKGEVVVYDEFAPVREMEEIILANAVQSITYEFEEVAE